MGVNLKDIRVGVIGGGTSPEREISLQSAEGVHNALKDRGVESIFIDLTTDQPEKVKALLSSYAVDIFFVALHGEFGEDGKLQAILDQLKLCYTGMEFPFFLAGLYTYSMLAMVFQNHPGDFYQSLYS